MAKHKQNIIEPDMSPQERIAFLENNAYKTENRTYLKPLTDGEVRQRLDSYVDNAQQVELLDDELKAVKSEFKGKTEPLKKQNKALMVEIKSKQKSVVGRVFLMANYTEKRMYTYNEDGIEIDVRKLYPEEMQLAVRMPLRAVSGGEPEGGAPLPEDEEDNE